MEPKKLYRSQLNKVFGGVCGGLAEYFDVDPLIMRILFVLLAFFGGSGLLLYVACLIIMPKKPLLPQDFETSEIFRTQQPGNAKKIFGIVLVGAGALILFSNLGLFSLFGFWHISWKFIFPVLLILLGMAIIYYKQYDSTPKENIPDDQSPDAVPQPQQYRTFRRSVTDKKLFGVCGGMAKYFSIDSTLIRILYIVLCLASFGAGIILYITLALVVPEDRSYIQQP
jgi:phage shock protein C